MSDAILFGLGFFFGTCALVALYEWLLWAIRTARGPRR